MIHPDVLVEGLRCAPGTPFFRWLVTRLRDALGVRYAFIGEFTGDDATRVHILATSEHTDAIDHSPYDYEIDGTAIATTPDADGFHLYPHGLRRRFPHVEIYQTLEVESLVCLRLADEHGRPLGILCALDTKPLAAPDGVRRLLSGLRARISGDLELRRVQRERQMLTETAGAARTQNALPRLVEQLARALNVRCAFVSEVLDDPPTRARTLALWEKDALAENVEYALAGTPCALVYERQVVLHARGLQRLYPDDPYLIRTDAQAYLGAALHDSNGRPIGHVGVLHNRPLHSGLATFPLFHVIVLLAGKELERIRATRDTTDDRATVAGDIAHDFNNLLAGILAHSGLALDELAAPNPVRARLEAIQLTAQRAAELARDMLDAPGTDRGHDEWLALGTLARETTLLLGTAIPAHVRIEFDEAPALPRVRGNPTQFRQILMNLLLNGVEAIGDRDGHVQVQLARSHGNGTHDEGPLLALTVADTGIGMTPATQARIFEPAFTTKARGRGIGLAVVRKLVERHGGTITVASVPRAGTRFTVTLPASDTPSAPLPTPSPTSTDALALSVPVRALLVDDDEGVRVTTAHMLRRLGCDVVTAEDGEVALAVLEHDVSGFDLALLDMAMPGLSGEDLVIALRRHWPAVAIVVMSGYASQDLARRLGQTTPLRFLQKPFGLDALRRCLHDLSPVVAPPATQSTTAQH